MDRRTFLQTLFAGVSVAIHAALNVDKTVELTLAKTSFMADDEFVQYVIWTMNMMVHNPSQCMVITGIEEIDKY